jgi:hypothetical protein
VAERAARFLAHRIDRRGILKRSALIGSALAVAPTDFALRPRSAYAAICRCSGSTCDCAAQCCDGYTEFCCTISGRNQCPGGTVLGGWWKVDGSSFCGGGPRYYMDCNATCGGCGCGGAGICSGSCSGTTCGCANGSCGNRKAGCTGFRYGQCHQEIACLGPILCRVVTCTPPWQIDGTCTTAVRTDNNTRYHDAPCLRGDPIGNIEVLQRRPDGIRIAGWALDPDVSGSIEVHAYVNGQGFNLGEASMPRPDVAALHPMHPNTGFDTVIPWSSQVALDACIYAINEGSGGNTVLACRSIPVSPMGLLDSATRTPAGVRVRGWALDPETDDPVDVHVYLNGIGFNLGPADTTRGDVAAGFPQWGGAHGFDEVLPWSGAGTVEVGAYAINLGGGANSFLGSRTLAVSNTPFGAIDVVRRVPGGIEVRGWALDPDTTAPVDVHVYVGGSGTNLGAADEPRPDVGAAYPDWGSNHGFSAVIPWTAAGAFDVCAYAINAGPGSSSLLGCRRLDVGNAPYGRVDRAARVPGGIHLVGWAIDPDVAGPVDIHAYVNGTGFNLGPANRPRPDVGQGSPGYGDQHGFDTVVPWAAGGSATVCVYAINAGAGSTHASLGCHGAG